MCSVYDVRLSKKSSYLCVPVCSLQVHSIHGIHSSMLLSWMSEATWQCMTDQCTWLTTCLSIWMIPQQNHTLKSHKQSIILLFINEVMHKYMHMNFGMALKLCIKRQGIKKVAFVNVLWLPSTGVTSSRVSLLFSRGYHSGRVVSIFPVF